MTKNLHNKPFDEGTLTKLEIFEKYLKEWLPVFIQQGCPKIFIVDFFAGPGKDIDGKPGSPLRIMETIFSYKDSILNRQIKVEIVFNEYDKKKYEALRQNITAVKDKQICTPRIYNEDFKEIFYRLKPELENNPVLLFMDQNGVKHITKEILFELNKLKRTDFLFFISSSYIKRFCDDPSYQKPIPDLNIDELKKANYNSVHRIILEHYKKMLSPESPYRLIPFSIKKAANIYGLIFGTKHILGADKFLNITWKLNKINGEANFDIDEDIQKKEQPSLFQEFKKITKLDEFEENMIEFVSQKKIVTNKEIYNFTLDNGFIHIHAVEILKKLIEEKKVKKLFSGRGHFVGYKQCYKEEIIKKFEWIP